MWEIFSFLFKEKPSAPLVPIIMKLSLKNALRDCSNTHFENCVHYRRCWHLIPPVFKLHFHSHRLAKCLNSTHFELWVEAALKFLGRFQLLWKPIIDRKTNGAGNLLRFPKHNLKDHGGKSFVFQLSLYSLILPSFFNKWSNLELKHIQHADTCFHNMTEPQLRTEQAVSISGFANIWIYFTKLHSFWIRSNFCPQIY